MDILHIGEEVVKFLVYGVGIGYIGRRFIGEFLLKKGKAFINKSERSTAIWTHYQNQAIGKGHASASPEDCGQDNCQVFGRMPIAV